MDKLDKAREVLSKGVALYPNDVQMRFHLGMAEDRLNHFDAAMEQFQFVLKVDPKNAAAMNYLGYSWADRGQRLEEAEKLLRQAVAIEPDSGAYLDSLGWVRYKRGDSAEARHFLELAVMHTPDPLIYDHLGDACLLDKHPEAALQAWSKTLSMDPKNEAVRKKVQDQGALFFGSPDAKKYLKYLEGNFKQAKNLSGSVTFDGRLSKRKFESAGKLYYEQPDKVKLDVPATAKTGAIQYALNGSAHSVTPPNMNSAVSQMAFDGLSSLSKFLSGSLTDSLRASVDSKRGVVTQFSQPNPSGGQDVIDVVAYDFVEGIWLPSEMQLKNETTGYSADITFTDWVINSSDSDHPVQ
jgi:tetratricopeptide (TPR) repeat protein